jgi:hypothetical protein
MESRSIRMEDANCERTKSKKPRLKAGLKISEQIPAICGVKRAD